MIAGRLCVSAPLAGIGVNDLRRETTPGRRNAKRLPAHKSGWVSSDVTDIMRNERLEWLETNQLPVVEHESRFRARGDQQVDCVVDGRCVGGHANQQTEVKTVVGMTGRDTSKCHTGGGELSAVCGWMVILFSVKVVFSLLRVP